MLEWEEAVSAHLGRVKTSRVGITGQEGIEMICESSRRLGVISS